MRGEQMIRADLELGGELTQINLDVKTKKEAIEKVWEIFGISTTIINLYTEIELEEGVVDGNSSE